MTTNYTPGKLVAVDAGLGVKKYGTIQRLDETRVYIKHYDGSVAVYKKDCILETVAPQQDKPQAKFSDELKSIMSVLSESASAQSLDEDVMDTLHKIVKGQAAQRVKFATGETRKIDHFTASAITQVHNALTNDDTKKKFADMVHKSPAHFMKAVDFAFKRRTGVKEGVDLADLVEKKLTPAELKKREEVAKAIERDNPDMPMGKKMAIATATAKKVAEENDDQLDEVTHQAKTTMKHITNPTPGEKQAAKDIKRGVAGYRDRIAMFHSAAARGGLKKEEVELDEVHMMGIHAANWNFDDNVRHIENVIKMHGGKVTSQNEKETRVTFPADKAEQAKKAFKAGDIDVKHYGAMGEEVEIDEAMSHQAQTTMKHIKNPTPGEKKAAKDIKRGVAGYRDRIAMFHSAAARGGLKEEEVELDEAAGTHPETEREKKLAALAHPKDKITHKDVMVGRGVIAKEEQAPTVPKTEREKKLAALAHPKDKITHADVMVGRGVSKEEVEPVDELFGLGKPRETDAQKQERLKREFYARRAQQNKPSANVWDATRASMKRGAMEEMERDVTENLSEMDKSAPQPGRDGKVSHRTYGTRDRDDKDDYFTGKESPVKAITAKQAEKDALEILKKQGVAEAKDIVVRDPQGKVKKWMHIGDWKKSTEKKDPVGKMYHMSDVARRKSEKLAKEDVEIEESEQIDEISKATLGRYIKKASHDVAAKGAATRQFANDSEAARKDQDYREARKKSEMADKTFAKSWKRREGMAKAVDRFTKE